MAPVLRRSASGLIAVSLQYRHPQPLRTALYRGLTAWWQRWHRQGHESRERSGNLSHR